MLKRLSSAVLLLVLGLCCVFAAKGKKKTGQPKLKIVAEQPILSPGAMTTLTVSDAGDDVTWFLNDGPPNPKLGMIEKGEQADQAIYTAPKTPPESHSVTVTARSGALEGFVKITLTDPKPKITAVKPKITGVEVRMIDKVQTLVITGEGFVPDTAVDLNGSRLESCTLTTPTKLKCNLPEGQEAGTFPLVIKNSEADGDSNTSNVYSVVLGAKEHNEPRLNTQSFHIVPPQTRREAPAFLWLSVIGSSLSALALLFTIGKLNAATNSRGQSFDSVRTQLNALQHQASTARSQYDDLASRPPRSMPPPVQMTPPPPQPQPLPTSGEPRFSLPSDSRMRAGGQAPPPEEPPLTYPIAGTPEPTQPAAVRDALIEDYYRARTSDDRSARDQFETTYSYFRITCANHEEWLLNKGTTLRFQKDDYGWYLLVSSAGNWLAFPWFTQDLAAERQSFEGVFQYPDSAAIRLRVASAAILKPQGDDWILGAPGAVEADV